MLLQFREPPVVVFESVISRSGKYKAFYGIHYEAGYPCYVVGTTNKLTGEIVMRHYNETIDGCLAPKATAATIWERFKTAMVQPSEHEDEYEDVEGSDQLASWFERADQGRSN